MAASSWVIAMMLLSVMAVKLLWGADSIIVAHLTPRERWHDLLRDGGLYLGWYMVLSGLFFYGAVGYALMRSPYETVPMWFAVPCAMFTADIILAWQFLGKADEAGGGP